METTLYFIRFTDNTGTYFYSIRKAKSIYDSNQDRIGISFTEKHLIDKTGYKPINTHGTIFNPFNPKGN